MVLQQGVGGIYKNLHLQGKSNNNNEHLWFIFYVKNIYFVQKHSTKSKKVKVVYTIIPSHFIYSF